jgi:hypothetical protein
VGRRADVLARGSRGHKRTGFRSHVRLGGSSEPSW